MARRALALAIALAGPITAISLAEARVPPRPFAKNVDASTPSSLRDLFSVERDRILLNSSLESDRLLALGRLARLGTSQALSALNGAVNNISAPRTTLAEGRVLIELLSELAPSPQTQHSLLRILTGAVNTKSGHVHPSLRATAALALALDGSPTALAGLSQALHGDRESADYAAQALLAYPPVSLDLLSGGAGNPSVAVARLFGDLGDQRSFDDLRRWIRYGAPELQDAAALSLTKLGDYETAELARSWLKTKPSNERQRIATEILLVAGSSDGETALLELWQNPEQADAFIDLALRFPSAGLVEPILSRLDSATAPQAPKLFSILGRAGNQKAVEFLGEALRNPHYARIAGFALGQCASPFAKREVQRALGGAKTRREALRAAVLRRIRFGERYSDLSSGLESLARSRKSADVALGVWGLSALDPERARKELGSKDLTRVNAAAHTALLQGDEFFAAAAQRLATATDPNERLMLAFALLHEAASDSIPTEVLLDLATQGTAPSPLAALALARRDNPALRPTLVELLNDSNAALRAHTALGLARSRDASATGLLVGRYRRELDWRVRFAIVTALAERNELLRNHVLEAAARLDPVAQVRSTARLALTGTRFELGARGTAAALIQVISGEGDPSKAYRESPAALLYLTPALALPFAPDEDGSLLILGVSTGPIELRVAAPPDLSKSSTKFYRESTLLPAGVLHSENTVDG